MGRNRKPSKKRSAASSTADKPLEQAVFYLDESIYSRALAAAISDAGGQVKTPADAAGFGAADKEWLALVAKLNWIVLMRDQRVRYRPLERNALMAAGVGAFVFTGGQATALDTAQIICRLMPKFANIFRSEKRPFLYSFGHGGSLSRIRLRA